MPTPIRGQSITAPPKVDATLSNTSSNTVQNQAVANALAGAYDATATYAVGDLCIYDGILYECTTAITTAEAWDATHWKTGNFGEKVSDLNRHLNDKQDKTNYVNVTGTTLTLNPAVDNTMYLCGELTELTVTAPASGIFAVRFTSGTTPTVVTFTGITMPDDWPTTMDASTTYEINVLNGFGVWQAWI